MSLQDDFIWLSKLLYPEGRAFRMPEPTILPDTYVTEDGLFDFVTEDGSATFVTESGTVVTGGILYRMHRALGLTQEEGWAALLNVLDCLMPDNPNFTIQDAHDWYRRLGIYDSGLETLDIMKAAISQKMSFPYAPLNMQSPAFIQEQLHAAGFDVFVYKNRFSDGSGGFITKTPAEVLGTVAGEAIYNEFLYNEAFYGGTYGPASISLCVNYLEEAKDATFGIGDNYRHTFYIAGSTITTYATIPTASKTRFRQLLLTLKRCEMAAFLFIIYT